MPRPVLAGFINGVALLIVVKQVMVGLDVTAPSQLLDIALGRRGVPIWRLALGVGLTALILWAYRFSTRVPAPVIGVAIGMALYHVGHWLTPGLDLGPVLGSIPVDVPPSPPAVAAAADVPAADVPAREPVLLAGELALASGMLAALSTLETFLMARPVVRRRLAARSGSRGGSGPGPIRSACTRAAGAP